MERVVEADRPTLTLIERHGDPRAAVAFAARHGQGSAASAALAGLFRDRLAAQGLSGVEVRAHALGLLASALCGSPSDAERFVHAVRMALSEPVKAREPALAGARREGALLRSLTFAGPAEAAVASCSGELGLGVGEAPIDPNQSGDLDRLERARAAVFRAHAAAFTALGTKAILEAASEALDQAGAWPDQPPETDPWPDRDQILFDRAPTSRRLSLAVRVSDANAAVRAGELLGSPHSDLITRLRSPSGGFRLERVLGVARPTGGCVRLDLLPARPEDKPTLGEVGLFAALVERSLSQALDAKSRGALDESALEATDPRRASEEAAWASLSEKAPNAPIRRLLAYQAPEGSVAELQSSVLSERRRLSESSLEQADQAEPGQGEIWMLLGSPCGTSGETASDAGALSVTLRALAGRAPSGVAIEPWVTPDGAGLLAHGPRATSRESFAAHARRLARALGRALSRPLSGSDLALSRAALADELGGKPAPAWAALLSGLSEEHPSWLDPRGTFESVTSLTNLTLLHAQQAFLSGPLKVAILKNAEEPVGEAVHELESWLYPYRARVSRCPEVVLPTPLHGERSWLAREGEEPASYVGVTMQAGSESERALLLVADFLNRQDAALGQSLRPLGARAESRVLGAGLWPALVVSVSAPAAQREAALAATRAILDQIASGRADAALMDYGRARLARDDLGARFDPRRRVVELYRGGGPPELSPAAWSRRRAELLSPRHWVVIAEPSP